jgi:hypothetical protein
MGLVEQLWHNLLSPGECARLFCAYGLWKEIALGLIAAVIFGNYAYHFISWVIRPEAIEDGASSG